MARRLPKVGEVWADKYIVYRVLERNPLFTAEVLALTARGKALGSRVGSVITFEALNVTEADHQITDLELLDFLAAN